MCNVNLINMIKIKNSIIWFVFVYVTILFTTGCNNQSQPKNSSENKIEYVESDSGLKYKILKEGTGEFAESGDEVLIFETTRYRDGTDLYSNENSNNPIKVKLGANMVTKGVEEGLQGMRSGEIRKLIVPHYLAKRKFYPDNISPDSTLVIKLIVDKVIKAN